MVFKIDFIDGRPVLWSRTDNGVERTVDRNYNPRFYIGGDFHDLRELRVTLTDQRNVVSTCFERWKPTLCEDETKMLRVDVNAERNLKKVSSNVKRNNPRSKFRFYNLSFSPQFRYCIQNEIEPSPDSGIELNTVELELPRRYFSNSSISELRINGEKVNDPLEQIQDIFTGEDQPDIVFVNRGQLLELLQEQVKKHYTDFSLGRDGEFEQIAGENTVSSYGKTVHSSARYNIPGRVVIDKSNSFLYGEATLEGLWDLVSRSYRPLQELAWGSIGRLLTSIEIKKAYIDDGNVLTPHKNWEGEKPKKASTLHKADRGGFIFNPEPEIHENVYEADFASLFPNIMIKKNISPETVCCSCCENDKVPELDYSICENQRGFISETLKPLVQDRQEMKEALRNQELDEETEKIYEGSVDAIKWLLVSCFGYMGHAHASYGAIRCHQAIQAYDREIMVKAKEIFEENGYKIVHGIIDSIWVQPVEKTETVDIEEVCGKVSEEIGIELELEHHFEWVGFCDRSNTDARIGTLNRYFGKKKDGGFKTAGIEIEQDSSCEFVKKCQKKLIERFDRTKDPKEVIDLLKNQIDTVYAENVSLSSLVIEKRVSKKLEDYKVNNRSKAALERAKMNDIEIKPGQRVQYVVRDDEAITEDRVRLSFEADKYDPEFYNDRLIKAAASVLSPAGWNEEKIRERVEGYNSTLKMI